MSVGHYDDELYGLDQRVSRLGLACGVGMNNRDIVVALIDGNYMVSRRGHRVKQEELRALVMLKYKIEARCIDALGAEHAGASSRKQKPGYMGRGSGGKPGLDANWRG